MMARSTECGDVSGPVGLGSVVRSLALVGATLTTGLISGFFYAYACAVTRGLALLPDAQYVAAMQAINATVRNGVFVQLLRRRAVPDLGGRRPRSAAQVAPVRPDLACMPVVRRGWVRADARGERADERGAGQGGLERVSRGSGACKGSLRRPVELLERDAHRMLVVGVARAHRGLLIATITMAHAVMAAA